MGKPKELYFFYRKDFPESICQTGVELYIF